LPVYPARLASLTNDSNTLIVKDKDVPGIADASLNRKYHKQLAEFTAHPEAAESQIWEPLYHHACAKEWAKVLTLASQAYFRRQFYALRSPEKIFEDITLALRAAREQMDAVALFRLLLIEHELKERKEVLEQVDIPKLVLSIEGVGALLDFAMDGNHLQIDQASALNLSRELFDIGEIGAARTLFEAAEPLEWLSGSRAVETHHGENNVLSAWIRCAYRLRPLETVLNAINTLIVENDPTFPDTEQDLATEEFRTHVGIALVEAIAQEETHHLWADFRRSSTTLSDGDDLALRLDFNICRYHANHPEAIPALERILAWVGHAELKDIDRMTIAEYLLGIRGDANGARQYVEGIGQPPTYSWSGRDWKNLAPFVHRIRLNRLLATLGIEIDHVAVVPESLKPQERGNVIFERHLVIIASLWGMAKREQRLSGSEIVRKLYSALRLFQRDWKDTKDWTGWYEIEMAANDYFELIIRAVAAHGEEAVIALSNEFERLWTSESSQHHWSSDRRHKIALALYRRGDQLSRLVQRLESLQEEIGVWDGAHERVEYFGKLAESWCEIGETDRARALIPRMLEGSFGIWHRKDRQLQQWVDVLTEVGVAAPGLIERDLPHFAAAILVLEKTGRGRGAQEAATELLALVMNINPAWGWRLCEWLWENGGIQFDTGVAGLLLGALRTEQSPIELILNLVRYLYIPFVPYLYEPLAKQLAAGCIQYSPPDAAHRLLDELNQSLQVKAWPNERPSWWRALVAGIRQAGGDAHQFEKQYYDNPGEQDSSSSVLILKDGRKVTLYEARVMVGSYSQLVTLFESIEKTDHFPWSWLLEPLIEGFSADQIHQLLARWEPYLSEDALRNGCALRLHQLGLTSEALAMLEPMVRESSASGWDRHWDGGTRQTAFRGLIAIDPKHCRPRALKALIDDYTSEYRYPVNLIYNWEELTEILFERVPWEQLWPEFRDHIYQLAEFSLAEDIPRLEAEYSCVLDEAFLSVYSWAAKLPINEVRNEVHKGLCEIMVRGLAPRATKGLITSLLTDKHIGVIQGLAILMGASLRDAPIAEEFSGPILDLCQSPDFVEREMAGQLAEILGIKQDNTEETGTTKLPLIYILELPSIGNHDPAVPNHAIHPGEALPDSTDPLEMIRPHQDEIEWLSRITDYPLENLFERTVYLMRFIKPESVRP